MFLHVLTHVVFSLSACSITCCVFARAEEDLSHLPSTHHAAPELGCSSPFQSSVGHIVVGMVVDSAVPREAWSTFVRRWERLVVGVCASKVCTQTAFCTSHQVLLGLASRDRALVCSGSSCYRFGLQIAIPPKLCKSRHNSRVRSALVSPQLSLLRLAVCLVVSGHLSTQTCSRRLTGLHVWWSLLSWSLSSRACAVPALSTSSAASCRCSRMYPPRGHVEGPLLPELLLLSCSGGACHEEPSARVVTQFCAPCRLED